MKNQEKLISREDIKRDDKAYNVFSFVLDSKEEKGCLPSLENRIEAYIHARLGYELKKMRIANIPINRYLQHSIHNLVELGLLDASRTNAYLGYLEAGKTELFLDNVKENLCYRIADELFPKKSAKHAIAFYNSYQKIGEAVLNYYKNLKEKIEKPEIIRSKKTLLAKLGLNFPVLTAKQRAAIDSMLTEIRLVKMYYNYEPLDTKLNESEISFSKNSNEKHLLKAVKHYKQCQFQEADAEYKKLLGKEPNFKPLINKFMHLNRYMERKVGDVLKKYDNELKKITGQKKSLVSIVQDLREEKHYKLLGECFRALNKESELKLSYLLKILERAVIESKYKEDFFFIDSIHFDIATEYQSIGKDQKMLEHLKKIDSEDLKPYACWLIALTCEDLGKHKEAVSYWKKLSKIVPKDFEIIHNRTNEVGHVKSPLLKHVMFKQNTEKKRPKMEFKNLDFIFNRVKDRIFNVPIPIAYTENHEGKSYTLFKEVKPFIGKALTLMEELEHCKKELKRADKTFKQEHSWFDKEAVLKEYKNLLVKNVIDHLVDMQINVNPKMIKKHIAEFDAYNYEKTLEEKLVKRVGKPEILEHSKPIISYLKKLEKVFGHCDLYLGNILNEGYGRLNFIDFEGAALAPRFFDLCSLLENFNLAYDNKEEALGYFVSELEEKGCKVDMPHKSYLYSAAFANMRILGGCLGWTERTGKKYTKRMQFHRENAIKAVDEIIEKYASKEDSETLLKLKKSLDDLRIR